MKVIIYKYIMNNIFSMYECPRCAKFYSKSNYNLMYSHLFEKYICGNCNYLTTKKGIVIYEGKYKHKLI